MEVIYLKSETNFINIKNNDKVIKDRFLFSNKCISCKREIELLNGIICLDCFFDWVTEPKVKEQKREAKLQHLVDYNYWQEDEYWDEYYG